jgi:hypothetical protein
VVAESVRLHKAGQEPCGELYDLIPSRSEQLEMFSSKSHAVAEAMDKINDKYGEFVITPAPMMGRMTRSLTGLPLAA